MEIGTIFSNLHISGKSRFSKDLFINFASGRETIFLVCFRRIVGILLVVYYYTSVLLPAIKVMMIFFYLFCWWNTFQRFLPNEVKYWLKSYAICGTFVMVSVSTNKEAGLFVLWEFLEYIISLIPCHKALNFFLLK